MGYLVRLVVCICVYCLRKYLPLPTLLEKTATETYPACVSIFNTNYIISVSVCLGI